MIQLQPLIFLAEDILRIGVGVRPLRKRGIRIERETVGEKIVVHNYGHKGSGWTLSWGSALQVLELIKSDLNPEKPIAVIGAGACGLTVAVLLAERGFRVNHYAQSTAEKSHSAQAAGLWYPGHFWDHAQPGAERLWYESIIKSSYQRFQEIAVSKSYAGVSFIDRYSLGHAARYLEKAYALVDAPIQHFDVKIGHTLYPQVLQSTSLRIDIPQYYAALAAFLAQQQVPFFNRSFHTLNEFKELPEQIIINCTGIGARTLCDDAGVRPVKGQLIYYKLQPGATYALDGYNNAPGSGFYLHPRSDGLVLGATAELDKNDTVADYAALQTIINQARIFFK